MKEQNAAFDTALQALMLLGDCAVRLVAAVWTFFTTEDHQEALPHAHKVCN
jgi:hypothetical protein